MQKDEYRLESLRLAKLYKDLVSDQIAKDEIPIDQEMLGEELGVSQSRISQLMTGHSVMTAEQAIIFSRVIGCKIEDFSPRISALLKGVAVTKSSNRIAVINGSTKEVVAAAKKMADGKPPKLGEVVERVSYPYECSKEVRAFVVDSEALEPEVKANSIAYVDPTLEPCSGDLVALIRNNKVVFAKFIGDATYETINPKFPERIFTLTGNDRVVGVIIGDFRERIST